MKNTLIKNQNLTPQNIFAARYLKSCRFQLQNPDTFEVTAIYLTRTDKDRFRVKVFRGGKCLIAKYVQADSFETLLRNLSVTMGSF